MTCRNRQIILDAEPIMVGIVNVTPDSFYDGGKFAGHDAALAHSTRLIEEGAGMLDLGGQSTRPRHEEISADEEITRILPVLEALVSRATVPLSVDTYKPAVARAALHAGAHVLNDIHGLQRSPELAELGAEFGCPVIVMHNERGFEDWTGDPLERIRRFFEASLEIAARAGLRREQIILDPGIGFSKTPEQNLAILGRLRELKQFGCPLLVGASRKSTIGRVLGGLPPEERLEGTLATTALAVAQGVEFIRVHDVQANLRAAKVPHAIRRASSL
jgi:dihydropteroate synthase